MKDNLVDMKNALAHLTDDGFSAEQEKNRLLQVEEELHFLFRKNDRLLQELKSEWKTGEMNFLIHDTEMELRHHQRKAVQAIDDEVSSLNRDLKLIEEKERDLQQKIRNLSASDD